MAAEQVRVLIGSPLDPALVEQIRAVDPRLEVTFRPDLLGTPRYDGDHYAPAGRDAAREAEFRALLAETEVLFDFDATTAAQIVALAPRLHWIQSTSAGVGQAAKRYGLVDTDIIVTTASGVHAGPLAEFVLMAMLMFTKRHGHLAELKAQRKFERFASGALPGKTLAIIGPGKIGREIARLARPFGVRLTALGRVGRTVDDLGVDQIYTREQLHTMLGEADFVVLAVPHTAETEGLLGAPEIAAMKLGAVLINIARGLIVDEDALIAALRDGHLAGAALDVFRQEPLPADSPFWELPNVIINSHSASTAEGENAKIVTLFCENLRHYLAGQPTQMQNILDKQLLY
jgi:phosphoglycerate dehydrogenase-like enzyme